MTTSNTAVLLDSAKKIAKYTNTEIDLGTGDGRFVYKNALKDPQTLYIGIEPGEKQMEPHIRLVNRKKMENAVFLNYSFETLPMDVLRESADRVHIHFPWGSLLRAIVLPEDAGVLKLKKLLKPHGTLNILFGYEPELEPAEVARLQLTKIDERHVKESIIPVFVLNGFHLILARKLEKFDFKKIESTWGKRLVFGRNRPMFQLVLRV